jgi:murein DD-endopeptidase MepM/ murein hydrolase activator NlpD
VQKIIKTKKRRYFFSLLSLLISNHETRYNVHMIIKHKIDDLLVVGCTLKNKQLCQLFEPIFNRFKNLSLPFFYQRISDTDKAFNINKIDQLSKILINALLKAEEIYFTSKQVISQFCQQQPLTEKEAEVLFDYLIADMSLSLLAQRDDSILSDDEIKLIQKWQKLDPYFLVAIARDASGYSAIAEHELIIDWFKSTNCKVKNLFDFDLNNEKQILLRFDQSQEHISMIHDVKSHQKYVENLLKESQAKYAIGLYGEDRACYQAPMFQSDGCHESRSVHLGIDVFLGAYEKLHAPIAGKVFSLKYNAEELDYGYTIILEHTVGDSNTKFYTLYGHLSERTLGLITEGDSIKAGDAIGYIGDNTENGGWSPHLHFQIMTTMLSCTSDFYGACEPSLWPLWKQICPDPNLLMRVLINNRCE